MHFPLLSSCKIPALALPLSVPAGPARDVLRGARVSSSHGRTAIPRQAATARRERRARLLERGMGKQAAERKIKLAVEGDGGPGRAAFTFGAANFWAARQFTERRKKKPGKHAWGAVTLLRPPSPFGLPSPCPS